MVAVNRIFSPKISNRIPMKPAVRTAAIGTLGVLAGASMGEALSPHNVYAVTGNLSIAEKLNNVKDIINDDPIGTTNMALDLHGDGSIIDAIASAGDSISDAVTGDGGSIVDGLQKVVEHIIDAM
ncbi:hypothetical protein IKQ21_03915 [bacterium]|nr:hypothetical protein [bacterium]